MWAQTPWGYSDWLSAETAWVAREKKMLWEQDSVFMDAVLKKKNSVVFFHIHWIQQNCIYEKFFSFPTRLLVPAGG